MKELDKFELILMVRHMDPRKELIQPYEKVSGVEIYWGDLTNYAEVFACVKCADIILHVAAFVSPAADYDPLLAMKTKIV